MEIKEVAEALSALQTLATETAEAVQAGNTSAEEAKAVLAEITPKIEVLTREHDAALQREEVKAMQGELTTLAGVVADLRKPSGSFTFGFEEGEQVDEQKALESNPYFIKGAEYEHGKPIAGEYLGTYSYFHDVRMANKGDAAARERLYKGFEGKSVLNAEGKAMTEGTAAQGGYLVRPQVERQLVLARELDNVLRALCSKLNVTTNSIQLDQLGISTTAGWVAELATKTESTAMTLATVTASVFTAAGLATVSNQLLADANPAVDGLVTSDLAKRLVALEETAFIAGTGTGQPLGILNTPGIGATSLTATDILSLLDGILDSIAAVETSHGAPTAILMHPRTWTRILKARDSQSAYYIDPTGGPTDPRTGLRGPQKTLWGYPVVTSNRVPTNLGGGTNESRVIVADFREALILDRQGITVDESAHVYFTSNQTVFRAEQRVGFTAARTPLAFNVVGGAGLANG